MKKAFFVFVIISMFLLPGYCQDNNPYGRLNAPPNKITVKTERAKYGQTEVIEVLFFNGLNRSVFSHAGGPSSLFSINKIERKKPGAGWESLFAQCQYPNCIYDINAPLEIGPGVTAVFGWKPLEYPEGKKEAVLLEPGSYRLLINYQLRPVKNAANWNWITTYSNEFTITK